MDPDVGPPDVHAVETAQAAATDDGVVNLAVGARVHDDVELRGVDQRDVVEAEVGDLE